MFVRQLEARVRRDVVYYKGKCCEVGQTRRGQRRDKFKRELCDYPGGQTGV